MDIGIGIVESFLPFPAGLLVEDVFKATDPGKQTPPPKEAGGDYVPNPSLPKKAPELKDAKFFVKYKKKSDEIFNDEKRPVPPLPGKATGTAKQLPDFVPKSPAVSKIASPKPVDILPPPNPAFVMPPFNPDRVLTDEEGLNIILHFSVFEDGKNIVAENANKYFLENVLLYSDPNNEILKLFGITRPVLTQRRLDICDEIHVQKWYSYYSFFYLPLMVANGNYSVSKKINADLCKERIHFLETSTTSNNTYAHQRMLLFKYAFCEKNQWMQKFQKNAQRWLPLYMQELKDEFNLAKHTKMNTERTTEQFQAFIVNAKAILDIFDPTGETSKNMINIIIGSSIFVTIDQKNSIKDTPTNRQIIKDTIQAIINQVNSCQQVDADDIDQITIGKDLIAVMGGSAGAVSNLQKAILATQFESIDGPDLSKGYEQYFKDIGARIMNKMQFNVAEKRDKFFKWLGRAFKTCQIGVIIYSVYNWDKLDTYNKAYFLADIVNIGLDLGSATKVVPKAFKTIGQLIGVGLNKVPYKDKVLGILEGAFTTDLAEFVSTRFSPFLIAVSALKSVYDCVQDAQAQNMGALVLDVASAGIGIGVALAIFGGCCCTGPLALFAGAVLLTLASIKYIFFNPSNDEIFFDKLYDGLKL
ncbi:hypothetical protein DFA_01859 [Cavenderia fasciculata]|uniref:Uncharacterized protein n=1 Tax=Cavenderia fasciculata TaxID=261658 RepID=F4PV65_CACFS|nr:uncharacterized protein DFA_01859 [Cavenderia fasciculata]EGG21973.1 hypothetical protein DFA_01859 [Cavenderia fasciculata]|eukprot:XP_004359824.1 hypothetical protein DFA_01859 [Cavenderia fasciculata]